MSKELTKRQFWQCSQGWLGLFILLSLQSGVSIAAPVAKLDNWNFDPETARLEINLSANTTPRYFYLSEPPRLVVDLPSTNLGDVPTIQNYLGVIQRIRVSQLNDSVTRIVLDLVAENVIDPNQIQLQLVSLQNPTRWVLSPTVTSSSPTQVRGFQSTPNLAPTNHLQLPSTLPLTTPNPQQPFVTVPPLNRSNSPQLPGSVLPPSSFPQQPLNRIPNNTAPDFSVPIIPQYQPSVSNGTVIEFGQPLPRRNY
ncbi:AMIN domain-containing protein [Nodularia chucula]|uniref:AMIN domain-containing protein n=1 Tax=Nodularia chucula TaxID=3093667 RepID=UPI0039C63005